MRLATFNVQNLRLRRRQGRIRFDGARDGDVPVDQGPAAAALDLADRRLTAAVLAMADADVIVLQEVFDQATLDAFHDLLLAPRARAPWPWRHVVTGNDGGGRHLAVLARQPARALTGHADLTAAALGLVDLTPSRRPAFCRDVVRLDWDGFTLFCAHLKAAAPGARAAAARRRAEARALAALIAQTAPGHGLWLLAGDLNAPPARLPGLRGLGVDLIDRLPRHHRWTWAGPGGETGRPDALIASPALAARWPESHPVIMRAGMGHAVRRHRGARLPGVGQHRPRASDHACLVLDLPGLDV